MTSRVHDAITAAVALLQATAAVTDAATVVDGPFVTGDTPRTVVFVGYDGDPEGDMAATENWTQDWAGLGALRKNEAFDVLCAVVSWSGDAAVAARRQTAVAVIGAVESAFRGDVDLGLPSPTTVLFASGQLFQEEGPFGLQARIPFTVHVETRV